MWMNFHVAKVYIYCVGPYFRDVIHSLSLISWLGTRKTSSRSNRIEKKGTAEVALFLPHRFFFSSSP
jgi:hypothetical protein